MIARLRAFGAFWYDFVVGDDWRVAVGVVFALVLTYLLSVTTSIALWWVLPAAVVVLLPYSLLRVIRSATSGPAHGRAAGQGDEGGDSRCRRSTRARRRGLPR